MHKTDLRAVEDKIASAFTQVSGRGGSQYSASPRKSMRKQITNLNTSPVVRNRAMGLINQKSPRVDKSVELQLSQSDYKDQGSPNKNSQTSFVCNTARSYAPVPNETAQNFKKRSIPTFKIKSMRKPFDAGNQELMEVSSKQLKQLVQNDAKQIMIINNKFNKKRTAKKNEMN